MPLQQLTNTSRLCNKENAIQADDDNHFQNSPIKHNVAKHSPNKKSLTAQINQLKIKLSDREFQLKKLQEDCTFKLALIQKQLAKEKNQKKIIIKQSKEKLEEDKQYFQIKIKNLEEGWKKKQKFIEEKVKHQTLELSQKQLIALKEKYQTQLREKNEEIKRLKISSTQQKQFLINTHKMQFAQAETARQTLIQQMNQKNEQQIIQLRQQHLSEIQFYHQMEDEKTKENGMVVKILSDKVRVTQEELRNLRERVRELIKQLQAKEEELVLQRRGKEEYRLDKVYLERKLGRLEPDIKEQYQKELQSEKRSYKSLLEEYKKQSEKQLLDLKSMYQQSTENYENQISQMQERCRQVSLLHQSIKSNEQDLRKIEVLEMKLIKKEMELEKQRQDVKMCKLELSNMDQIFHKMFEEAKLKSLRPKRHRLPSLLTVGQNRSTMDIYSRNGAAELVKQRKKFSIRQLNYNGINKSKEGKESCNEFTPYE